MKESTFNIGWLSVFASETCFLIQWLLSIARLIYQISKKICWKMWLKPDSDMRNSEPIPAVFWHPLQTLHTKLLTIPLKNPLPPYTEDVYPTVNSTNIF